MMLEEFEKLTNIYPSAELYKAIEVEYANDEYKSKEEFCEAYKANKNNYMAERIQRAANDAAWKAESETQARLREIEQKYKAQITQLAAEKALLERKLECEQEWKDNGVNSGMDVLRYNQLAENPDTKILNDSDAIGKIALEFGFDIKRITINRVVYRTEKNRHGAVRNAEALRYDPCYNSTDWNYIKFEAGGYTYEMVNGGLNRIYD